MIIIKYLVKNILQNQFNIIFVLIAVFLCQKLIRTLDVILNNNIPIYVMLGFFGLGISEMLQLILPLSIFFGIIFTLNRLYTKNEIITMYACGFNKNIIIKSALILGLVTTLVALINIIWISPWALQYQQQILLNMKTHPNIATLIAGQFHYIENNKIILFVDSLCDKEINNIFLVQNKLNDDMHMSIMLAQKGHINQQLNIGMQLTLNKGILYEGDIKFKNFFITDFDQFTIMLDHNKSVINRNTVAEFMNMKELYLTANIQARTEFHWRLTLIIAPIIMSILAVSLSEINLHQLNVSGITSAILIYLFFFLLQILLHYNGIQNNINSVFWVWFINIFYLLIALMINFWNKNFLRN